jgi:hypothetical protein
MNKITEKILIVAVIVLAVGAIIHTVNWLISKGVIYVVKELWNIDWSGKFWPVYVMMLMVATFFGGGKYKK